MLGMFIDSRVRGAARSPVWRVAAGAIAVAGLVAATGPALGSVAGAKGKKAKTPVYIGSALGTTGAFAGFDAPQVAGLKAVTAEVNKKGGILGHPLVYVNVSDNSQTTKYVPAMQQLLGEHKYLAVFPTPVGMAAMAPYTNQEKIITFDGGTPVTTEFNPQKYPYDFNDAPLATIQLHYVAKALLTWAGVPKPKIGIIVNTVTASELQMTELSKLLTSQGYTVLPEQKVAPTATDVSLQLQQLESEGANIVYPFSLNALCTATFEGVQTLAWKVKILGSANCLNPGVVKTIPATVIPEVRYVAVSSTMTTTNGKPKPSHVAFNNDVHAIDPTAAVGISGVSADAVHDLVWAADYTKSLTETKLLKALNEMYNVKIPTTTRYQEPNPRWSPSDHVMDRATFNTYYGMAKVTSPQVTGLWPLTQHLAVPKATQ